MLLRRPDYPPGTPTRWAESRLAVCKRGTGPGRAGTRSVAVAIVCSRVGDRIADFHWREDQSRPTSRLTLTTCSRLSRAPSRSRSTFSRPTRTSRSTLASSKPALKVVDEQARTRFFHGVVDQAEFVKVVGDRLYFRVRMVPALAALAHRENCRIFQNMTTIQVVQNIFEEAGFGSDVQWSLTGSYLPREFIVQYRESSLYFVSLAARGGGDLRLLPARRKRSHDDCRGQREGVRVRGRTPGVEFTIGQGLVGTADALHRFTRTRSLRTTNVLLRDYDFEKPQLKPEAALAKPMGGRRRTTNTRRASRSRPMERAARPLGCANSAATPTSVAGKATPSTCGSGCRSSWRRRQGCLNGEFVVTSLTSRGSQSQHGVREDGAEITACTDEFAAIPLPYGAAADRPQAAHPRGPDGARHGRGDESDQSIHCDNYGRIKVQFFRDRDGQLDENASCWLRTTQAIDGGRRSLPRVGWELSVRVPRGRSGPAFRHRAPRQRHHAPPYSLPGAKASGSSRACRHPEAPATTR